MDIILIIIVASILIYVSKSFMSFEQAPIDNSNSLEVEAKLIVALMSKVAKADGRICELEAELLSHTFSDFANSFSNPLSIRKELKEIYENEKDLDDNIEFLALELYKLTKFSYKKRVRILEYLLNMAFIDKEYTDEEESVIITIAEKLEIKQEDFITILNAFKEVYEKIKNSNENSLEQAYKILGVNSKSDTKEIKIAYRKLVKENHPDIISGKGLGENAIKEATIRLQEINSAYEKIKSNLGK